jgi:hypothetical protein
MTNVVPAKAGTHRSASWRFPLWQERWNRRPSAEANDIVDPGLRRDDD